MTSLMKWIVAIVVLMIVASVIGSLTRSGGSSSAEARWAEAFMPVIAEVNRAGIAPARAMSAVELCQTETQCEVALQEMADSFTQYRLPLMVALRDLPHNIPRQYEGFQQDYRRMLELRLEAVNLWINAVEDGGFGTIWEANEKWNEALMASSDVIDRLATILE